MIRDMPDHAQTIAYPAPGARPHRFDLDALAPHVIVLFGATGDLAKRKLIPGLAYLDQSSIAPEIRVVGTSLEDITTGTSGNWPARPSTPSARTRSTRTPGPRSPRS